MSREDIFQIVSIPINYCADKLTHMIPDLDLFFTGKRRGMARKLLDSGWGCKCSLGSTRMTCVPYTPALKSARIGRAVWGCIVADENHSLCVVLNS